MKTDPLPEPVKDGVTFGKTIQLLLEIAKYGIEGAYKRLAPRVSNYIKLLLYATGAVLITVPVLGILKAVTGYVVFSYLMASLGALAILFLGLTWSPLSILVGLFLGETHSPKTVGVKYVRIVAITLFIELMAGMYISFIPLHRQPHLIPVFFIAAAAVALGSFLWGGFFSGRFYTFVALAIIAKITLSAFYPQTFRVIDQWWSQLDGNIAQGLTEKPQKKPARAAPETRPAFPQTPPRPAESQPEKKKISQQQSPRPETARAPRQTALQPPVQKSGPRDIVLVSLKPHQWSREEFLQPGGVEYLGECHWLDFRFKENGKTTVVRYHAATQKYFLATESGQTQGPYNGTIGNRRVSFRSDGDGVVKLTYRDD